MKINFYSELNPWRIMLCDSSEERLSDNDGDKKVKNPLGVNVLNLAQATPVTKEKEEEVSVAHSYEIDVSPFKPQLFSRPPEKNERAIKELIDLVFLKFLNETKENFRDKLEKENPEITFSEMEKKVEKKLPELKKTAQEKFLQYLKKQKDPNKAEGARELLKKMLHKLSPQKARAVLNILTEGAQGFEEKKCASILYAKMCRFMTNEKITILNTIEDEIGKPKEEQNYGDLVQGGDLYICLRGLADKIKDEKGNFYLREDFGGIVIKYNSEVSRAIYQFQMDNDLEPTGYLDTATKDKILRRVKGLVARLLIVMRRTGLIPPDARATSRAFQSLVIKEVRKHKSSAASALSSIFGRYSKKEDMNGAVAKNVTLEKALDKTIEVIEDRLALGTMIAIVYQKIDVKMWKYASNGPKLTDKFMNQVFMAYAKARNLKFDWKEEDKKRILAYVSGQVKDFMKNSKYRQVDGIIARLEREYQLHRDFEKMDFSEFPGYSPDKISFVDKVRFLVEERPNAERLGKDVSSSDRKWRANGLADKKILKIVREEVTDNQRWWLAKREKFDSFEGAVGKTTNDFVNNNLVLKVGSCGSCESQGDADVDATRNIFSIMLNYYLLIYGKERKDLSDRDLERTFAQIFKKLGVKNYGKMAVWLVRELQLNMYGKAMEKLIQKFQVEGLKLISAPTDLEKEEQKRVYSALPQTGEINAQTYKVLGGLLELLKLQKARKDYLRRKCSSNSVNKNEGEEYLWKGVATLKSGQTTLTKVKLGDHGPMDGTGRGNNVVNVAISLIIDAARHLGIKLTEDFKHERKLNVFGPEVLKVYKAVVVKRYSKLLSQDKTGIGYVLKSGNKEYGGLLAVDHYAKLWRDRNK